MKAQLSDYHALRYSMHDRPGLFVVRIQWKTGLEFNRKRPSGWVNEKAKAPPSQGGTPTKRKKERKEKGERKKRWEKEETQDGNHVQSNSRLQSVKLPLHVVYCRWRPTVNNVSCGSPVACGDTVRRVPTGSDIIGRPVHNSYLPRYTGVFGLIMR